MIGILYQFIVANHLFETNYNIQHYINYMKKLKYPLSIIKQLHFEDTYHFMLLDKKMITMVFKWSYLKFRETSCHSC